MATSPMQDRMNVAYDTLRVALARMEQAHAEIAREDIIIIMAQMIAACKQWPRSAMDRTMRVHMPAHIIMDAVYGPGCDDPEDADEQLVIRARTRKKPLKRTRPT